MKPSFRIVNLADFRRDQQGSVGVVSIELDHKYTCANRNCNNAAPLLVVMSDQANNLCILPACPMHYPELVRLIGEQTGCEMLSTVTATELMYPH